MSLIPLISNLGVANNYKSYSQTQSPFMRKNNNGFVRTNYLVISQNKMRRKKIELEFNSIGNFYKFLFLLNIIL
jgi:hypothetical protein